MSPCPGLGKAWGCSILRDPNTACLLDAHPKIQVVADVFEEAPNHGGQMDDMGGLVLLEQGFGLRSVPGMGNFGVQQRQGSRPGGFTSKNKNPCGQLTSSQHLWRTRKSTPHLAAPLHQPPPSRWLSPPSRCHPLPGCVWGPAPSPPSWPKPCGEWGGLSCGHLRVHPATDHRAHPHPGMGTHEHQP